MRTYLVGGAVRDRLLQCTMGDRDWVVVGSTPEAMLALGYTPVGKDTPWRAPSANRAGVITALWCMPRQRSRSKKTWPGAT